MNRHFIASGNPASGCGMDRYLATHSISRQSRVGSRGKITSPDGTVGRS